MPIPVTARDLISATDWDRHSLGHREAWPPSLRIVLDLILSSPHSSYLVWGESRTFFFNDAYMPILGPRLPDAMGARFEELWADAWPSIKHEFLKAIAGESTLIVEKFVPMARYGVPEETWWTFSYSPARDDDGVVQGVLCLTNEVTDHVQSRKVRDLDQRRLQAAVNLAQLGTFR